MIITDNSKKNNTFLLLLIFYSIICNVSVHCMNDTKKKYFTSVIEQTIPSSIIVLTQVPQITSYMLSTPPATCYNECIANCTTYVPPLCHLDFILGTLATVGTGATIFLVGAGTGFLIKIIVEKYLKNKATTNENSALLKNSINDNNL